jgi:hypothetical protein
MIARPPAPPKRRLVRLETLAEEYDLSPRTIRQWIAQGLFAAYRVGDKSLRIDAKEFETAMVTPLRQRR